MVAIVVAKFDVGQTVRHRVYDFGGVVEDVDPSFCGTEEWYDAIAPERRPDRDQPFYHLRLHRDGAMTTAYVSQANLVAGHDGVAGGAAATGVRFH